MTKKDFWKIWSNEYQKKYKCGCCNKNYSNLMLIKKRSWERTSVDEDGDYEIYIENKTSKICKDCFLKEEQTSSFQNLHNGFYCSVCKTNQHTIMRVGQENEKLGNHNNQLIYECKKCNRSWI